VVQNVLTSALAEIPQELRMSVISNIASGLSEYTG
jgi:hypothetical protein